MKSAISDWPITFDSKKRNCTIFNWASLRPSSNKISDFEKKNFFCWKMLFFFLLVFFLFFILFFLLRAEIRVHKGRHVGWGARGWTLVSLVNNWTGIGLVEPFQQLFESGPYLSRNGRNTSEQDPRDKNLRPITHKKVFIFKGGCVHKN